MSSPPTVLVVDDDDVTRMILRMTLENDDFRVVEAQDGAAALASVEDHDVDLVLLDNRLPGIDGLEVLRRLRLDGRHAGLPVILVTGDDDVPQRVRGLHAGADDYVVKPFTPAEIVARVRAQLRARDLGRRSVERRLSRRAELIRSLRDVVLDGTFADGTSALCRHLTTMDGVLGAALLERSGRAPAVLGAVGATPWPAVPYETLADVDAGPTCWPVPGTAGGDAVAVAAPVGDDAVLALVLGRSAIAATHNAALATAADLADVVDALIGADLRRRRRHGAHAANLTAVLAGRDFEPHFQPIRRLSDGMTVGVEALTRFGDGVAPDVRFQQAADIGLGIDLELATMRGAVAVAGERPEDGWLALNVSPTLLAETTRLEEVLDLRDGEVVLELSEHDPVRDYRVLRDAMRSLPDRVRLSVDDAGAGFASLQHILELRPQFMKLDRGWVNGVHDDPARQALIAGLRHFATSVAAELIAEGIETVDDLRTLQDLGIDLGQGFLLGRPAPAVAA